MICKICNQEVIEKSHFYKLHKIKEKDYYEQYYPRFDLYTKEPISFKSSESYFLTDFNDKRNLRSYLEIRNRNEAINYLQGYLIRRKEAKNLCFAPTEFEIKTMNFPSLIYLEKKYGLDSYQIICNNSGLQIRSNYSIPAFNRDISNLTFFSDTREQNPLKLSGMQVSTLSFGDYTLENSNIFIERKSLPDFLGTLSQGYERIQKEIERCKKANSYIVILLEEKYSNLQSFEYLKYIHSKCTWAFISHRIRELSQIYPCHLQFLAVDGRKEATRVIEKIYCNEQDIMTTDLQYLYNRGNL